MWKALKEYFSEFKILAKTPREFWIMNLVINFFEMLAYFAFITVLKIYLTDNLGLSDQMAGNIMAGFLLLLTIIVFCAGFIIDSIGIKRALFISMIMLIPCRMGLGVLEDVETYWIKGALDTTAVRAEVEKGNYDKTAFTREKPRYQDAQIAIALAAPTDPNVKKLSHDEYKGDTKALHDAVLAAAKTDAQLVASYGGNDFETKLKSPDEYRKLVVQMVGQNPKLADTYYDHLDRLQGDALRDRLVTIVKAVPELRAEHSPQTMLWGIVCLILFFTAIGEALMSPGIYIALRRYTNNKTSGAGFNFQYLTMNIGAVLSFIMFDALRNSFGNASIIQVGTLFAVICTIGVFFLRGNIEVKDGDECEVTTIPEKKVEDRETPWAIAASVLKEAAFWRFILFLVLLLGVRLNFTHQFLVMPSYYDRVLGSYSSVGALNTINPIIITIGLILMIPVLNRFRVFDLIVVGTTLSALSVFALVIPGKAFTGFGLSIELGYLILILAQIIIFAFGELIWSPRLSEYTVTVAPKGREGAYMGLAALPMFIAKPLNSWLSGLLLTNFCPDNVMEGIVTGAVGFWNGPEMMWLILGVLSISSPILVVLLKNVIKPKERDHEESAPAAS